MVSMRGRGTVVRLLRREILPDGRVLAEVLGLQRFTTLSEAAGGEERGTGGVREMNVTMFVDGPVRSGEVADVLALAKRVRRGFHSIDTDAMASARAKTLGNAPGEAMGPEVLSHWLSMALPMTVKERVWLLEERSTLMRLVALAKKLGVATEKDIKAALAVGLKGEARRMKGGSGEAGESVSQPGAGAGRGGGRGGKAKSRRAHP